MPRVFVKTKGESERREVPVDNVEGMAVEELKNTVSLQLSIPLDSLNLIYGGRLLRVGKKLGHYKVVNGCTIHLVAKKPWNLPDEDAIEARQKARLGTLLGNRRILRALGRMMSNPSVVQSIMEIPTLANNSIVLDALQNPQLLNNPDAIAEFLEANPEVAFMMDSMLRMHAGGEGGEGGEAGEDSNAMVDVVEEQLEDARQASEMTLQMNRVQMFEHSQALRAHEQQVRSERAQEPQQESSRHHNPFTSRQHGTIESAGGGGGMFTQHQLSSALAGALSAASTPQPSPLSSLNFPDVGPSSAPASLSVEQQQPASVPVQASGQEQGASQVAGSVSREDLSTAVQGAFRLTTETPQEAELPPRVRYTAHLEQLHNMGITDDAACLHALEATGGDLQAALEILYSM